MGNVPKLRFEGFTDEWERRKLKNVAESFEYGLNVPAKEFDGVNKYLRITDIDDSSRIFRNDELTSPDTDLSLANNYRLHEGDILFARTGASVGKSFIYRASDGQVYFAGFLIRARIRPEYRAEFVFQNTFTAQYEKYIQITSQRSGQPGVNAQEYGEYKFLIPEYSEQKKIGDFLHQLDNLITLYQRKYKALETAKRFYLQNMFPQKGETKPRLRFAGFSGDWEQRKFSEFTRTSGKRNKNGLNLEPYAITSEHGFIPQSEAHDEFGYMKDTDRSAYNIVSPNSFGYNPARINIGSIGYYAGSEDVIVSSLYEIFQTAEEINDSFLSCYFSTTEFMNWIQRLQEGSVRLYFYYDKLCECRTLMPSFEEQQVIASFHNELDRLIILYNRKLEALKTTKKFLLQNMFV